MFVCVCVARHGEKVLFVSIGRSLTNFKPPEIIYTLSSFQQYHKCVVFVICFSKKLHIWVNVKKSIKTSVKKSIKTSVKKEKLTTRMGFEPTRA